MKTPVTAVRNAAAGGFILPDALAQVSEKPALKSYWQDDRSSQTCRRRQAFERKARDCRHHRAEKNINDRFRAAVVARDRS